MENSRSRFPPCGLPLKSSSVGTLMAAFRSSIALPVDAPVYASRVASRRPRKTRGQDGSLLLSCKTLAFSTFCRFSPAHRLWPSGRTAQRINKGLAQNSGSPGPRHGTQRQARMVRCHERAYRSPHRGTAPGRRSSGRAEAVRSYSPWLSACCHDLALVG